MLRKNCVNGNNAFLFTRFRMGNSFCFFCALNIKNDVDWGFSVGQNKRKHSRFCFFLQLFICVFNFDSTFADAVRLRFANFFFLFLFPKKCFCLCSWLFVFDDFSLWRNLKSRKVHHRNYIEQKYRSQTSPENWK